MTQHLDILQSSRTDYPYYADMRQYTGSNFSKISNLTAHMKDGTQIHSQFTISDGIAHFASRPVYLLYDYPTGYTGTASNSDVPRSITVKLSIPTRQWTYIPHVEAKIIDPSGDVITSEGNTRSENEHPDALEPPLPSHEDPSKSTSIDVTPSPSAPESNDTHYQGLGSSGGGCNSGFGILAAGMAGVFCFRRRRFLGIGVFAAMIGLACVPAFGEAVKASDYTLPIPMEIYTPAGTWTTDFEFTAELAEKVAEARHVSADRVHSYSEIIIADTWDFKTWDMNAMAVNGFYAGIMLPVTKYMVSGDFYVIKCTFSNDIQPDELIAGAIACEVDLSTGISFYDEKEIHLSSSVTLDDNFNLVESVPENRTVYLAVSIHTNAGVLAVVRGKYVEEEDPLNRLDAEIAQRIADELGVASSDLKFLTRANIGKPIEPTDAMKKYVASDDHEIIINLPTVSVDEAGIYIVPVTLSGDMWEMVQGQSIADYKFYALNDSDLGKNQMRPVFINGFAGTWEVFTLSGEKMDSFGMREFLMVGFLEASKPFSLYLARLIIMLLLGGCNSGIAPRAVMSVLSWLIVFTLLKKH